jgi:hypothetical protein
MTNRKITIRFTADKNGKRRAHYWGLARRWLPISVDAAELKLATGEAFPQETTATAADKPFIYTSVDGDVFDRVLH